MRVITVARKPLKGTVAANVLEHGTGAINVGACVIPTEENLNGGTYSGGKRNPMPGDTRSSKAAGRYGEDGRLSPEDFVQSKGRWPANLIHDDSEAVLDLFPECRTRNNTAGVGSGKSAKDAGTSDWNIGGICLGSYRDGTGSAARFFKQFQSESELCE